MYNNAFICYNSCPIPTPKNSSPTPHLGFDCAGSQRHQKQSHKTRYGLAARKLLENVKVVPPRQPAPTALLSTVDTNLANIREWAILDSGASSHFLQVDAPLLLKRTTANPIVVTLANGEKASSTHEGMLDVPGLPDAARNAHVIPGIKHSLLSIVRLCNAGCEVVFDKWGVGVEVRYRGRVILAGSKSTINGLWYVPITQNSEINLTQHMEPRKKTRFESRTKGQEPVCLHTSEVSSSAFLEEWKPTASLPTLKKNFGLLTTQFGAPMNRRVSIKGKRKRKVNLGQHCGPQQKTATYAPQEQNSFLATSRMEFSMPQPPVTTDDDEMTLKTSNATQNAPIAANVTTQITTFSREELAMYHHQSLGNPRKETLMSALKENPSQFETFPGLTHELIRDHLPPSKATEKGAHDNDKKRVKIHQNHGQAISKGTPRHRKFPPSRRSVPGGRG